MRKICVYALTGLLTVGSITSGGIHNASARGKDAEAAVCVENKEDKKEAKRALYEEKINNSFSINIVIADDSLW